MPKDATKSKVSAPLSRRSCIYARISSVRLAIFVLTPIPFEQKKVAAEKKGGKKGKDGPKRALSAYMFFSQDWRERIKSENPDAGFGASDSLFFDGGGHR
jgi:hypothetical protein